MRSSLFFIGGLVLLVGILAGTCFCADEDARFKGGSYDGYDSCTETNTTIQSGLHAGTIFTVY